MDSPSGPAWTSTVPALVQQLARSGGRRVAAEFEARGLLGLRPGHAVLLVQLMGAGRHASDLADTIGVSRQAVAQAVAALERGGYVERVLDPGDRRAKLVCLTGQGRAALRAMRASGLDLERQWSELLGPAKLQAFRETLTLLLPEIG